MQSKLSSFMESIVNVMIGFFVALISQILVFPFFGIYVDIWNGAGLAAVFTGISLVRSYVVRRVFNKMEN